MHARSITLLDSIKHRAKALDLIVMLPFQKPFAGTTHLEDVALWRNPSFSVRYMSTLLTRQLIMQSRGTVMQLPNQPLSVDEHVEWVVKSLRERRGVAV